MACGGRCPVVMAIGEIRGAGLDDMDGEGTDTTRHVKIGGNSRIVDEIAFLMTTARLDFARFELGLPTETAIRKATISRYISAHGWDVPVCACTVYARVLEQTVGQSGLLEQLEAVEDLQAKLAEIVVSRLLSPGLSADSLAVSVPDPVVLERTILFRPDMLYATVMSLKSWTDKLYLGTTSTPRSSQLQPPDVQPPAAQKIDAAAPNLASMRRRLDAEMAIYERARLVEAYHCKVIRALEETIDRISDIIAHLR